MPVIASTKTNLRLRLYGVGTSAIDAFNGGNLYSSWGLAKLEVDVDPEPKRKVYTTVIDVPHASIKEA